MTMNYTRLAFLPQYGLTPSIRGPERRQHLSLVALMVTHQRLVVDHLPGRMQHITSTLRRHFTLQRILGGCFGNRTPFLYGKKHNISVAEALSEDPWLIPLSTFATSKALQGRNNAKENDEYICQDS